MFYFWEARDNAAYIPDQAPLMPYSNLCKEGSFLSFEGSRQTLEQTALMKKHNTDSNPWSIYPIIISFLKVQAEGYPSPTTWSPF